MRPSNETAAEDAWPARGEPQFGELGEPHEIKVPGEASPAFDGPADCAVAERPPGEEAMEVRRVSISLVL